MKDNSLKEIWQTHIDVQEQMLQLRSAHISIIPESANVVGEKLHLTVDENDKSGSFIDQITSIFEISASDVDLENGYLLVDTDVSQRLSKELKKRLSERAVNNFIKFQPEPVIDGFIESKSETNHLEISLIPNPVFFLKSQFPEYSFFHKTLFVKKIDHKLKYLSRIITTKEITSPLLESLINSIGLRRDERSPNSYSYDFLKYINILTSNTEGLFTYNKEEFLEQFKDVCNQNINWINDKIVFPLEKNSKVEDVIYDFLKEYSDVCCINFHYLKGIYDLENVELLLREKFPSIQVKKNNKEGTFSHAYL
jgi:hypothetical protein